MLDARFSPSGQRAGARISGAGVRIVVEDSLTIPPVLLPGESASQSANKRIAMSRIQSQSLRRNAPRLHPGEVAVWWLATENSEPADVERWLETLDRGERDRAARFHFAEDRREFVAAHALLRAMLAFYLDRPAAALSFLPKDDGKPMLVGDSAVAQCQFNLSHTRGLVAAAVAAEGNLGIDVEKIDHAKADLAVANRYFAPAEVAFLRQRPAADQAACFFRLWTLKEAYLKAIGTGLGTPLDSFAIAFDPIRISFTDAGDNPERWHLAMLPASSRHVLSVAIDRPSANVHMTARAIAAGDL
jgi:4'-phosphopantetheinyl transferase